MTEDPTLDGASMVMIGGGVMLSMARVVALSALLAVVMVVVVVERTYLVVERVTVGEGLAVVLAQRVVLRQRNDCDVLPR